MQATSATSNSPKPTAALLSTSFAGYHNDRSAPPPAKPDCERAADSRRGAKGVFRNRLFRCHDGRACRSGGPDKADALPILRVEGSTFLGDDAAKARSDAGRFRTPLG